MSGPLTGLRVIDLTRILAGPTMTQHLADLGAEVIKIERPGKGDDTRQWGPPWLTDQNGEQTQESSYYLSANRGKHSITIDIGSAEGRDLVCELAAQSDILVENFKTGDLAKKGLGYEELRVDNPGLIYCSITGFGQTGPMSDDPGYDYLIQAQSGLMSITGVPDGMPGAGPQRVGVATADLTTGMNSAIAVLAALHHRNATGEGQRIDMALLDVQVSWMANQAQSYFCSGKAPTRTGEYHASLVPYQPFPTTDGQLIIAVGNNAQFQRLCNALDLPELAGDPKFATNPARIGNRVELVEQLKLSTRKHSCRSLQALLRNIKVPGGPVQTIDEVFSDPQVLARDMVVDVPHPKYGPVKTVANPIKYSATRLEYVKAPPGLGEDTQFVLRKVLGRSDAQIAQLSELGIV